MRPQESGDQLPPSTSGTDNYYHHALSSSSHCIQHSDYYYYYYHHLYDYNYYCQRSSAGIYHGGTVAPTSLAGGTHKNTCMENYTGGGHSSILRDVVNPYGTTSACEMSREQLAMQQGGGFVNIPHHHQMNDTSNRFNNNYKTNTNQGNYFYHQHQRRPQNYGVYSRRGGGGGYFHHQPPRQQFQQYCYYDSNNYYCYNGNQRLANHGRGSSGFVHDNATSTEMYSLGSSNNTAVAGPACVDRKPSIISNDSTNSTTVGYSIRSGHTSTVEADEILFSHPPNYFSSTNKACSVEQALCEDAHEAPTQNTTTTMAGVAPPPPTCRQRSEGNLDMPDVSGDTNNGANNASTVSGNRGGGGGVCNNSRTTSGGSGRSSSGGSSGGSGETPTCPSPDRDLGSGPSQVHNSAPGGEESTQIRYVWRHNLREEFDRIRDIIERYPYVALDTEFPGVVARPTLFVKEYNYQTVKCNVDLLNVIQLGLTFADGKGGFPLNDSTSGGASTWQFNFRFSLMHDMHSRQSIEFLRVSGVDFERAEREGIEALEFGELLVSSGLVMNPDVHWISFHGCYDFGYLLKMVTCLPLPHSEAFFFRDLQDYFPSLYDIKFLLRKCDNLHLHNGYSLNSVCEHLNIRRIGPQHQAGSDSLVTCKAFFKLIKLYFGNLVDDSQFEGIIYGLSSTPILMSRQQLIPSTAELTDHPVDPTIMYHNTMMMNSIAPQPVAPPSFVDYLDHIDGNSNVVSIPTATGGAPPNGGITTAMSTLRQMSSYPPPSDFGSFKVFYPFSSNPGNPGNSGIPGNLGNHGNLGNPVFPPGHPGNQNGMPSGRETLPPGMLRVSNLSSKGKDSTAIASSAGGNNNGGGGTPANSPMDRNRQVGGQTMSSSSSPRNNRKNTQQTIQYGSGTAGGSGAIGSPSNRRNNVRTSFRGSQTTASSSNSNLRKAPSNRSSSNGPTSNTGTAVSATATATATTANTRSSQQAGLRRNNSSSTTTKNLTRTKSHHHHNSNTSRPPNQQQATTGGEPVSMRKSREA